MGMSAKAVFFVSKQTISNEDVRDFARDGFDLIAQKNFEDLLTSSASRRPFAIIIDGDVCGGQLCSAGGLLSKIQKKLSLPPVFLINATGVQRFELLKSDLAYAVFPLHTKLSAVLPAIIRYDRMLEAAGAKSKIRFGVSMPCLVKKLGASGLLQGEICDLSPNGMKVRVNSEDIDWQTGDEVRFSLNQKVSNSGHLEGYGQLRWSITDEVKPGVKETKLGFAFKQLPTDTLNAFLDLLNEARVQAN